MGKLCEFRGSSPQVFPHLRTTVVAAGAVDAAAAVAAAVGLLAAAGSGSCSQTWRPKCWKMLMEGIGQPGRAYDRGIV